MSDAHGIVSNNQGSGQAVSVAITESTLKWIALLGVGILAAYGAMKAESAYTMANDASMRYDLVYTHQIKEEAYLSQHGIPIDDFGKLPPPKRDDK